MFKNREFRVRVAKTEDAPAPTKTLVTFINRDDIIAISTQIMKNAVIGIVSVAGGLAVIRVASEIAIHHGTKS